METGAVAASDADGVLRLVETQLEAHHGAPGHAGLAAGRQAVDFELAGQQHKAETLVKSEGVTIDD